MDEQVIRVKCPKCRASLNAPLRLSGNTAKCPKCGNSVNVPNKTKKTVVVKFDSRGRIFKYNTHIHIIKMLFGITLSLGLTCIQGGREIKFNSLGILSTLVFLISAFLLFTSGMNVIFNFECIIPSIFKRIIIKDGVISEYGSINKREYFHVNLCDIIDIQHVKSGYIIVPGGTQVMSSKYIILQLSDYLSNSYFNNKIYTCYLPDDFLNVLIYAMSIGSVGMAPSKNDD